MLQHSEGSWTTTIPFQLSEKLLEAAGKPGELWLLEGGSHKSAQHDLEVQTRVADWLQHRLS